MGLSCSASAGYARTDETVAGLFLVEEACAKDFSYKEEFSPVITFTS